MKRLLYTMFVLLCAQGIAAQNEEEEQVLVYRNNGEINLFFAHELDSIVPSYYDADSIRHEEIVSQAFCTPDSAYIIPMNEIDSVAFGSRNEVEYHKDVRVMSAEDSLWIIRYDGNNIYYKKHTPSDILPRKGEKLFYGKQDALFPIGLIAKVDDVTLINDEYKVTVSRVEINEIFSKLFYAGSIRHQEAKTRAITVDDFHRNLNLMINPTEGITLGLSTGITVTAKIVCNPLIGYYHIEGDLENNIDANLACSIERGFGEEELSFLSPELDFALGTYALVFQPNISISAFLDVNAELSASLKTNRKAKQHFVYAKRAKKDPVFQIAQTESEDGGTSSQVDITCKGEVYYGVQCVFDMAVIGDVAGGRLRAKVGPSFQGEIGMTFLAKASNEYQPEVYGAAKLNSCIKLSAKGSMYHRDLWQGTENEHTVFEREFPFREAELDLFPHFFQTRAVQDITKEKEEISVATKSDNIIPCTLETGFELVDENDNVLDSVFTAEIVAESAEVQGVSESFDLASIPQEHGELRVRPVFHYAGYTIPAEFANVISDANIQPVVFSLSNGPTRIVSGAPYIGYEKGETTTYIAGPYIPIHVSDTVFNTKPGIFHGSYIDTEQHELFGTWKGTEAGTEVSYTFNEDNCGSFANGAQTIAFQYEVNSPQSGQINIYFDEDKGSKTLYVTQFNATTIKYRTAIDSEVYVIEKQEGY